MILTSNTLFRRLGSIILIIFILYGFLSEAPVSINNHTLAASSQFKQQSTTEKFDLKCYVIADQQTGSLSVHSQITASEYDLVIILGDINKRKMDTLLSMVRGVPIVAILGNHDKVYMPFFEPYNVHGKVVDVFIKRLGTTVRIGGFGGAIKEHSKQETHQKPDRKDAINKTTPAFDAPNKMPKIRFTEKEVERTLKKMKPVDIFISHVPPSATSGETGRLHRGFDAFNDYIFERQPQHWFHGHLEKPYTKNLSHLDGTKTIIHSVQNKLMGKLGNITIKKSITPEEKNFFRNLSLRLFGSFKKEHTAAMMIYQSA